MINLFRPALLVVTLLLLTAYFVFRSASIPDVTTPNRPSVITDPDAYAIYGLVLPRAWSSVSKEPLLLQEETEPPFEICVNGGHPDWEAVRESFRQENSSPRRLRRDLSMRMPYRLIPRADIQADDARLKLKYPGIWQRRPESMEYAAVSAVGFNPAKTRAMVYVRLRQSGTTHFLQLLNRTWVGAGLGGCTWMA